MSDSSASLSAPTLSVAQSEGEELPEEKKKPVVSPRAPKRTPPPRPARVTISAGGGSINGWIRTQAQRRPPPPAKKLPPIPLPPIPAASLHHHQQQQQQQQVSELSKSTGNASGSSLHRIPVPVPSPSSLPPASSSTASASGLSRSASMVSSLLSPRWIQHQQKQGEEKEEEEEKEEKEEKEDRPEEVEEGYVRSRKGSFSSNIFQNLGFWKRSATPSSGASSGDKANTSDIPQQSGSSTSYDNLHRASKSGAGSHGRSRPSGGSVTESKREDTFRALHGFLQQRGGKRKGKDSSTKSNEAQSSERDEEKSRRDADSASDDTHEATASVPTKRRERKIAFLLEGDQREEKKKEEEEEEEGNNASKEPKAASPLGQSPLGRSSSLPSLTSKLAESSVKSAPSSLAPVSGPASIDPAPAPAPVPVHRSAGTLKRTGSERRERVSPAEVGSLPRHASQEIVIRRDDTTLRPDEPSSSQVPSNPMSTRTVDHLAPQAYLAQVPPPPPNQHHQCTPTLTAALPPSNPQLLAMYHFTVVGRG